MEKLFDTSRLIDDKIISIMTRKLRDERIKKVIDAGSGKTSASLALKYFPKASVTAVVYPGDNRKKNPLETAVDSDRLDIVEADFCAGFPGDKYDFCLIHKTLGEAMRFGNSFESLFHNLMDIKAKFFVLIDVLEDPCVHYRYIEQYLKEKGFKIRLKKVFRNPKPEHYPKVKHDKYKLEYDSKHYIAYLIERL